MFRLVDAFFGNTVFESSDLKEVQNCRNDLITNKDYSDYDFVIYKED